MVQTLIKLSTTSYEYPKIIYLVQGDTGRDIICYLNDFTLTSDMEATLWFKRPNGTDYSVDCDISVTNNTATASNINGTGGGALSQAGTVACMLAITDTSDENMPYVSTFPFGIVVVESSCTLPSTSETVIDLQTLINRINQLSNLALRKSYSEIEDVGFELEWDSETSVEGVRVGINNDSQAYFEIQNGYGDSDRLVFNGTTLARYHENSSGSGYELVSTYIDDSTSIPFIAVYGTTPYSTVYQHALNGTLIGAFKDSRFCPYTNIVLNNVYFKALSTGSSDTLVSIYCKSGAAVSQQWVASSNIYMVQVTTPWSQSTNNSVYGLKKVTGNNNTYTLQSIEQPTQLYLHNFHIDYAYEDPDDPTLDVSMNGTFSVLLKVSTQITSISALKTALHNVANGQQLSFGFTGVYSDLDSNVNFFSMRYWEYQQTTLYFWGYGDHSGYSGTMVSIKDTDYTDGTWTLNDIVTS